MRPRPRTVKPINPASPRSFIVPDARAGAQCGRRATVRGLAPSVSPVGFRSARPPPPRRRAHVDSFGTQVERSVVHRTSEHITPFLAAQRFDTMAEFTVATVSLASKASHTLDQVRRGSLAMLTRCVQAFRCVRLPSQKWSFLRRCGEGVDNSFTTHSWVAQYSSHKQRLAR
jgi:hypothetical protein